MSIYAFAIPQNSDQFGWRIYEDYFTPEECDQLIADVAHREPWQGGIVKGDHAEDSEVEHDIRRVSIRTVTHEDVSWVYDKLNQLIWDVNQYFKYDLTGFMESMQLLHYGEDINGGHYDIHQDHGPGPLSTRKLTVIVQLSNSNEYEGCDTEVVCSGWVPRKKGTVVVFPSYTPHRVTELTKGERNALVVWVNGPPFK